MQTVHSKGKQTNEVEMQDIMVEEITNSSTFQDANTVSLNKKSFDTYGRMDSDMSVTENQHKKQTNICITTKLEIVTTDPSKEKIKTIETTSLMHENKTNKNPETTENSKKQKNSNR